MIVFKEAEKLSRYLSHLKNQNQSIAFVPTMGALHLGHISLLAAAKQKAIVTVCSIFVNPTQFNNADDFSKYPVTLEKDIALLTNEGCDLLFLPSAAEIYPPGYQAPVYDLGRLENVLEGKFRPGHFQGVCQVVDRLLQIVDPHFLFVGQKDYQQCQVLQKLLVLTHRTQVSLIISPTIRESDGLAMSSRNVRLSPAQRSRAATLYAVLQKAKTDISSKTIPVIKEEATLSLQGAGFTVDYFEIADAATLRPASDETESMVALVAAFLDEVRLIDNLPLSNH